MLLPTKTIENNNNTTAEDSSYFAFSLKKFWFCVDKKLAARCSTYLLEKS